MCVSALVCSSVCMNMGTCACINGTCVNVTEQLLDADPNLVAFLVFPPRMSH